VKHPDGPGGTTESCRAVTVPDESFVPLASTHAPTVRSDADPVKVLLTCTVVGTETVCDAPF